MNTVILFLIIVTVLFTVAVIIFILMSLKSQAYTSYKQKLLAFDEKKKAIEEEIENDRKKF